MHDDNECPVCAGDGIVLVPVEADRHLPITRARVEPAPCPLCAADEAGD